MPDDDGRHPAAAANLADLVGDNARRVPGHPAFLWPAVTGGSVTWAEVDDLVGRAAAALLALGLHPGDRVALRLHNTLDFPVAYLGALRAGLVAVLVNPGYTVPETAHLLTDSGARALLLARADAGLAAELRAAAPGLEHVVLAGAGTGDVAPGTVSLDALLAAAPSGTRAAERGGEDLAVLAYTSGTSGRPRGAMLSHRALLADLAHVRAIAPPVARADDVVLLVLPLFHIYGLSGLGAVLAEGATGLLVERFDPVETLSAVRRFGVTTVVGAPPMYVAWSMLPDVEESFAGVRLAVSGSAPLPAAVLARVLETTGRRVFEGYGLTETAPTVTSTLMSEVAKPDSIGRAVPGVEVRLQDGAGDPVEDGDPGEIVVRGANLFSGYWPDGAGGPDADGWFATGDVAFADADGDLHLVDRRRELVLVSGFNVYPREVEAVLDEHPDVVETAVLGIPHPYTGETVKALVVARPGSGLTARELVAFAGRRLARFKCPTAVEFLDALPRTATGKVSKAALRARG